MVLKSWKQAKFAASPANMQINMEEDVKRDKPDIYSMLRETKRHCDKVVASYFVPYIARSIFHALKDLYTY
ncbi:unnamed protein product [Hymenolepis diminuta]|uniref:PA28_beta domain-containing protein n=1 Tax=Hymenolepis diminuta TaxID=6216 RepID=A0A0R3SSW8_HYMDI|nr:unnamed protein product [Hymenolepis diminuta]